MKKITAILLCAVLFVLGLTVPAGAAVSDPTEAVDGILDWGLTSSGASDVQAWLDGEIAQSAGSGAEWYALALSKSGEVCDFSAFAAALEKYVTENRVASATTRQGLALAFLACGYHSDFIDATAYDSIGEQGLMSWVYGLHLLNNGVKCSHSTEQVLQALLERQLEDGGWAISGKYGDADATAMTVQALTPHRQDERVADAVERALLFLQGAQLDNGGFASYGAESPESAAQVLVMLSTLGIDAAKDARFLKNGSGVLDAMLAFRLPDGSFCHVAGGAYNKLATMQAFYSLVDYRNFLRGGDTLYHFASPDKEVSDIQTGSPLGVRQLLCGALILLAILLCVVFYCKGKRSWKNFAFVLLLAALGCYLVLTVDVQKTDDYYGAAAGSAGKTISTTITIRCDTVAGEKDYIPADGVVLDTVTLSVPEGSTAFDQLVAAAREYTIHLDKSESSISSAYIKGMANLYEFDFGDLSGWMFCVNGKYADVGCGEYVLREGDAVEWHYTRSLGSDIGDEYTMKESAD